MRTACVSGLLGIALAISGCQFSTVPENQDEEASIAAALGTDDEFDDSEDPGTAASEGDPEEDIADEEDGPMADEERALDRLGDVEKAIVLVTWGRVARDRDGAPPSPEDRESLEPTNWSGRIVLNRGLVRVRKALRFERRTDHLLPRVVPNGVGFTSVTGPGHDGLLLTVAARAGEPLTLTYVPHEGGEEASVTVALSDLMEGDGVPLIDDGEGNQMIAIARPLSRNDRCRGGFVLGQVEQHGRGDRELARFRGVIIGEEGDRAAGIRGVLGDADDGSRRMKGALRRDDERVGGFRAELGEGGRFRGHIQIGDGGFDIRGRRQHVGARGDGIFVAHFRDASCGE